MMSHHTTLKAWWTVCVSPRPQLQQQQQKRLRWLLHLQDLVLAQLWGLGVMMPMRVLQQQHRCTQHHCWL
jgi:hypothetical protein